jgi:hypothetical protein
VTHIVTVERVQNPVSREWYWQAQCACGWVGGMRNQKPAAERDGARHEEKS